MSMNNSVSFEQKNQFMPSGPKVPAPSFQNFMQACFTNPTFFESMKHFYVSQAQRTPQEPSSPSFPTGSVSQPNHQSQPSLAVQSRPDMYREEDSRTEYSEREINIINPRNTDMKRKPANPLAKYYPSEGNNSQKANEPLSKPTIPPPQKNPTFDQMPIRSTYTANMGTSSQNFDINTIKQNQSMNIDNPIKKTRNFDDEPIKGLKEYPIESFYKQPQEQRTKHSSYAAQDQRPIKGCAKDFKELVKQQFPSAEIPQQESDRYKQSDPKQNEPRTFLKRGSRQHLSSAISKGNQPKNLDSSFNKSDIDEHRDRSVTPRGKQAEVRSVSQNRVLDKRNTNPQEKSSAKMPNKKIEQYDEQIVVSKAKPTLPKERQSKPQSKKQIEKAQLPPVSGHDKKRKTKNVFNDGSESSSESQEQKAPYFKAVDKRHNMNSMRKDQEIDDIENKTEVIEGVYLSKEQLQQILERYGKVKQMPKQSESEKVVALRKKYNEMIALKDEEMEKYRQELEREREQFQKYKTEQINKLKNQRRVMERQVKSGSGNQNVQKQKEQIQVLKQQIQKERQDFKRKQKNSKIILQKYKKQNQELKAKLQRVQIQKDNNFAANKRNSTTLKTEDLPYDQKPISTKGNTGSVKGKKIQQDLKSDQPTYKAIKKGAKPPLLQQKQTKQKYEFVQEQPLSKNKSFSSKPQKKQPKIQNKWASHKFNSDSESCQSEEQKGDKLQTIGSVRQPEWTPTMKLSDLTKQPISIKMVNDQMISLFRCEHNPDYIKYTQSTTSPHRTVVNTTRNNTNSYTAKLYSDRTKELVYDNGTRKISCESGYSIVYFKNGDIKQTLPDKTVLYYFKEKEVDQITLPNGMNIYRFENNQVEFHFENGYIEIRHPDGTIKVLGSDPLHR